MNEATLSGVPQVAPGRVLVILCDSGWREWEPARPPGYAGAMVLPYPQGIAGHDPQDLGVTPYDVQVWSIRDPR
jgi:hypothetical protein